MFRVEQPAGQDTWPTLRVSSFVQTRVSLRIHPLRGGDTEVFALRRLEGPYWPTNDQLIAQSLSTIRETERLPSHACVVAWEFDSTDTPEQRIRGDVLGSIGAAGFQVDSS
jgi:hypothetical protein